MNPAAAQAAPPEKPPPARRRNPWWIPPFLGRVPEMPPETLRLLGVISLALLFENFDQATLTAALKQIALTYGVAEADLGRTLGFVHMGALPAFALVPFADRIGRRRLFLISVIGISVASCASAFAGSIFQFVAFQMVARVFMVTCSAMAFVIITEEFPAEHRGWGIGIVSAVGAFGVALALGLFAAIELLPFGWRTMYALGILPLLLLPMFRREIRETRRFARHRDQSASEGRALSDLAGWWLPLWSLLRAYPGRAVGIGLIGAFGAAGHSAVYNFSSYFVQSVHGWSPGNYTVMMVASGLVGIIGYPFAGRLADRAGRRRAGFALFAGVPGARAVLLPGAGLAAPAGVGADHLHAHGREHDRARPGRGALPDLLPGHLGGLAPARGGGGALGRAVPGRGGHHARDRDHEHDQRGRVRVAAGRIRPARAARDGAARAGGDQRGSLSAGLSSTCTAASAKGSAAWSPWKARQLS